jgi:hypothetical protein
MENAQNAPDSTGKTIAEKCGNDAAAIEAMRKRWSRYIGTAFDRNRVATEAEMSALYPVGNARTKKPPKENKAVILPDAKTETETPQPDILPQPETAPETEKPKDITPGVKAETKPETEIKAEAKRKRTAGQTGILYVCMLVPAIASVQNMWAVTSDISGHISMSVLLTSLFSAFPFAMTLAGVSTKAGRALVGVMIVYEAFCNFMRIYGGLTGFGKDGYPTRFLGIVTEVFNTGTYPTAIVLAFIMAALCAGVFYVSFNELKK